MGKAEAGTLMDGFGIQIEAFYPSSRTVRGDLGKWLFRQIVNSLLPYRAPSISRPC